MHFHYLLNKMIDYNMATLEYLLMIRMYERRLDCMMISLKLKTWASVKYHQINIIVELNFNLNKVIITCYYLFYLSNKGKIIIYLVMILKD